MNYCKSCHAELVGYWKDTGYCTTCLEPAWRKLESLRNRPLGHLLSNDELLIQKAKGESMRLGIPFSDVIKLMRDK